VTRYDSSPSARRITVVSVLTAAMLLVGNPAASAHPFGPPLTAKVSADGPTVTVAWAAAEDDWLRLGEHVGAFAASSGSRDDAALTGAEKLQRSESLRTYLLEHVSVQHRRGECAGAVASLEDPLGTGAELSFDCGGPVNEVDVTLSVLTDVNASYRTVATASEGASPRRVLFNTSSPTQHFTFGSGASSGGPPYLLILGLLLAAAAALVLAFAARAALSRRNRAQ
jgi:hypothetical protein